MTRTSNRIMADAFATTTLMDRRRERGRQRRAGALRLARSLLVHAALVAAMVLILFPILWMVSTAFKPLGEAIDVPPTWLPRRVTWENFAKLLHDRRGFLTFTKNSFIVCTATTLVSTSFSVLAGYGLSRFRFKGRRLLLHSILATQMFPLVLILIPLYILFRQVGLLDTYTGLVIAFTSFGLPFSIWIMKGFFDTVPLEIEEAARIDGCSRIKVLTQVVLPLTRPGIISVALYAFLQGWNNLLFPLTLTSSLEMRTIPPGFILTYVGEFEYYWTDMMAASTAVTIPVVLVFIVFQRYFVQGLTSGAVKG